MSLVIQHYSSTPEILGFTLDLIFRRKAIGAEALAAQRDAVLSGKYPDLEPKLRDLKELRMQIAKKTLDGPSEGQSPTTHQQHLEQLNSNRERIETELAEHIPELRLEQQLQTSNRHKIADLLSVEDALVEFVRFYIYDFSRDKSKSTQYVAFILPGKKADNVQMINLGNAQVIDR